MNELTRLQLRASELRSKLAKEEDPEKQDALIAEYGDVEREIRKATVLADDPANAQAGVEELDGENTEYRSLVARANVGNYFDAAVSGSQPTGVEKELQEAHNLQGNQVPLDLLLQQPREERAVTPAPTTTGLNQQEIEGYVFPNMVAEHLQVPMPRVATGTPLYPDVATAATVAGPHTDSTSVDETTGSFNTVSIAPARFQASFFYPRADAARFAGMDAALRQNLSDALSDALDKHLITTLVADATISKATAPTKALTYSQMLTEFAYGRVDGRWARSTMDLRTVVGTATYGQLSLLSNTLSGNQAVYSALNVLNGVAGGGRIEGATQGVRLSAHIPAVKSNLQTSVIRIGARRDAVFPVWEGVTLINDEVTRAKTGEIVITTVLLANFKLLRKDGFYLAQTYHA